MTLNLFVFFLFDSEEHNKRIFEGVKWIELVVEWQFLKDLFLLFKKGVVGSDGLPFLDLVYCGMGFLLVVGAL